MSWKQRLALGYLVGLAVVGTLSGLVLPARNVGVRFGHAILAICGVGVVAVLVLFAVMFVLAVKEPRASRQPKN